MIRLLGASVKDCWMVESKDKMILDNLEQGLRIVGWLGAGIKDGWMVGSKD